jgi:hypothetical protein
MLNAFVAHAAFGQDFSGVASLGADAIFHRGSGSVSGRSLGEQATFKQAGYRDVAVLAHLLGDVSVTELHNLPCRALWEADYIGPVRRSFDSYKVNGQVVVSLPAAYGEYDE